MGNALLALGLAWSVGTPAWAGEQPLLEPDRRGRAVPDRAFDILTLHLDLDLEIKTRSLEGSATYGLQRLSNEDFVLDQIDLDIGTVTVGGEDAVWRTPGNTLVVEVPDTVERGAEVEVVIQYAATPRSGLHFRAMGGGSPDAYGEVWSQGQKNDNRYWFPAWDHPNDRFEYTGEIRGPKGWKVLTNTGMNVPSYLIMLAAGPYKVVGDDKIQAWVGPNVSNTAVARVHDPLPDMMEHFAMRTGVEYPWGPYRQVFVQRFMYGGMENTSATINTDAVLVTAPIDQTRTRVVSLVAHELAHQWYGDYLTCRSWRDLWLNEGFATFMAADWMAKRDGPDAWADSVRAWHSHSQWERPMAGRFFHGPDAGKSNNVYSRGGMVLQMLRVLLGEEVFWAAMKDYTQSHGKSLVRTIDLQEKMEKHSGQELDWFFQQWVELPHVPRVTVRSAYSDGTLKVTVRQAIDKERPRYTIPFSVEVGTAEGPVTHWERLEDEDVEVSISLPAAPTYVAFDPVGGVLSKLTHEQEDEEWAEQLASPSPYAVIRAIRALGDTSLSEPLVVVLKDENRSPIIRAEAARALGQQRATTELLTMVRVDQDKVRVAVARALGKGVDGSAMSTLERMIRSDRNPDVRVAALSAVAQLSEQRGVALSRGLLGASHRRVVEKAVGILGDHGELTDVASLLPLRLRMKVRMSGFRAAARIVGRSDLGSERDRASAMMTAALVKCLKDLDLRARQTAVSLLGSVGTKKAIPHLEAFRRMETVVGLGDQAAEAVSEIRARQDEEVKPGTPNEVQARLEAMEARMEELEAEVESWKDKH